MNITKPELDVKEDSFLYKAAKQVSNILHPMMLSSVAFLLLTLFSSESRQQKIVLVGITTFFSSILPILFIYTQRKRYNTDERTQRFLPLIAGIVSYFGGFLTLIAMNSPVVIQSLMFCYATNTLLVLLITAWWKVSVHTTAASGPLIALTYRFGYLVLPFYTIILLVGLSRLTLKKHTVMQVIVGMLIGTIGTAVQMNYIFKVPLH
jgi:membrane-associated phospholipid phosphatase